MKNFFYLILGLLCFSSLIAFATVTHDGLVPPTAADVHAGSPGGDHTEVITNFTVINSNAYLLIRISGNRYIFHVETNLSMIGQSVQDIFSHVDLGGATFTLTDSTTEVIPFSNTVENIGGGWTSNRFDVPVDGFYRVYAHYTWTGSLTDQAIYVINIRTNNAQVILDSRLAASGSVAQTQDPSIEIHLNTETFVEFAGQQQGSGDGVTGSANLSFIEIRLIRED